MEASKSEWFNTHDRKWKPSGYMGAIRDGKYTVLYNGVKDTYAISVKGEIVSPWQSKEDLTYRVAINYNRVLDFTKVEEL